jgi:hypothetical protein
MHTFYSGMFGAIGTILGFIVIAGVVRLATWNPGKARRSEAAAEQRMQLWDARQRGKM